MMDGQTLPGAPAAAREWDDSRHAASMAATNLRCLLDVADQLVIEAPAGTPLPFAGQMGAMLGAMRLYASQIEEWFDARG